MNPIMYNRRKQEKDLIGQNAGEASADSNISNEGNKHKRRIKRFLQYMIPPMSLAAITLGIFMPSYRSDPVSKDCISIIVII